MMRTCLTFLLCLAATITLASCSGDKEDKTVIAVIPKGTAHEFWQSVHAGAIKAKVELNKAGENVEIIWLGPDNERERAKQISMVNTMRSKGVAGIVLAPTDSKALCRPVADAKAKGIPVVIIDSGLDGKDFISFVATDNRAGGLKGGRHLVKLLGGKGKVAMLRYQENSASTENREAGFMDATKEKEAAGIEVVSSDTYGGDTNASAQEAGKTLLRRFTNAEGKLTIDGIFCPNASTTIGMLMALRKSGFAGKVRFVGFDSTEQLIDALRKKEIDGLILQDPVNMGYMGVMTVMDHIKKRTVKPRIDTGAVLVTPDNINDPKIADLVSPDFDKWLKQK